MLTKNMKELGLGCEILNEKNMDDDPIIAETAPIGNILAGFRYREDLTQEKLSKLTGIPRRHISEMENGKRSIGKQNAKKLANALSTDYHLFL